MNFERAVYNYIKRRLEEAKELCWKLQAITCVSGLIIARNNYCCFCLFIFNCLLLIDGPNQIIRQKFTPHKHVNICTCTDFALCSVMVYIVQIIQSFPSNSLIGFLGTCISVWLFIMCDSFAYICQLWDLQYEYFCFYYKEIIKLDEQYKLQKKNKKKINKKKNNMKKDNET